MANRVLFRLAHCCSRVFMVEVDQHSEPLYFALSSQPRKSGSAELQESQGLLFGTGRLSYSLHLLHEDRDRVQSARSHAELKRTLSEVLSPECEVLEMASFIPDVQNSLERGFFVRNNTASSSTETILDQIQHKLCVLKYSRDESGELVVCSPTDHPMSESRCYITPTVAPLRHPATLNIINSVVFYSMDNAYRVLQECSEFIPESKAVLDVVTNQLKMCSRLDKGFPAIIIEGLDATGKSTLTCSLQKELGAVLLKSPPECLSPFRQCFDKEPPLIRRAFYALGNYITAAQIKRESVHAPVIVDRYWHSTAAYAIATAVNGKVENLPEVDSEIYKWPCDLLKPSLVLLLTVSPQERMRRLTHRGLNKTEEEKQLEINHLFRNKVEEAYKRIRDPSCIVVDANPSSENVLQQVLCLIRNKYSL